jgi:hypothetical protein
MPKAWAKIEVCDVRVRDQRRDLMPVQVNRIGGRQVMRDDHGPKRRLPRRATALIKQVAQHLFTDEGDIAFAFPEIGQVDRIKALLDFGDGLAQRPLDIELFVADASSGRPEQVFVPQNQLMGFQNHARVTLVGLLELALQPFKLHVRERDRFIEPHQLGSDFFR